MRRLAKILIAYSVIAGTILAFQILIIWEFNHTVAPYCWDPSFTPEKFVSPYLDQWVSWLPPAGVKTGEYCYNFMLALSWALMVTQFVLPVLLVVVFRRDSEQ